MNKRKLDILIESEVKQLTKRQIAWLNKNITGTWKYENGVINVNGSAFLNHLGLKIIPFKFGYVSDYFGCSANALTSLKGCPSEVGVQFDCCNNKLLTSLEHMPVKIGQIIYCNGNSLQLNNKLFEDLAKIGQRKIGQFYMLTKELKEQIPIQFGITDQVVVEEIWQSYMNILEDKSE